MLLGNRVRQLTEELGRRDFLPNVINHLDCSSCTLFSSAFTPDDVHNIKEFAKRKDCLKLLSQATRRV